MADEVSTVTGAPKTPCRRTLHSPVDYRTYTDDRDQGRKLRALLVELIGDGVSPGLVSILSAVKLDDACAVRFPPNVGKKVEFVGDEPGRNSPEAFTVATISGFKGLENDVIVLTDICRIHRFRMAQSTPLRRHDKTKDEIIRTGNKRLFGHDSPSLTQVWEDPLEHQDYKEFRSQLLRDLRRQLFGPTPNGDDEDLGETLNVSPLQLYGTGILFPQKLSQNLLEDSVERAQPAPSDGDLPNLPDLESGRRTATPDDTTSDDREPLNLANEFSPSASGISFRLKQPARLVFVISYGTYELIRVFEPHPRAGSTGADGRPFPDTREVPAYQRTHHEQAVEIEIGGVKGSLEPISVEGSSEALKLHLTVRERSDHTLVVSAMLVNHRMTGPSAPPSCDDVFCQVSLTVRHADGDAGLPAY